MNNFIKSAVLFFIFSISLRAQDFRFAAMSDSRGSTHGVNEPVLSALVDHLVKNFSDIKFVLFPGDLVDGSKTNPDVTLEELKYWKSVMAPIYNNPGMVEPKIWVTVGNHEIRNRYNEEGFRKVFPGVIMNGPEDEKGFSYSFDYNNCHFVFLNSNRYYYGESQDTTDDRVDWHYIKHLDWLEKDLKEAGSRKVKHTFIVSHEAAFPIGGHLRDALPNLGMNLKMPLDSTRQWYMNQRNRFWKILSENKTDAYICGHEHLYGREEIDGVYQIVAGSSGAPVYYFNSKFGENPEKKLPGQELTYNESIPYYEALNYLHGPGRNSQASENFVGFRAFEYVVFDVKDGEVKVQTYGAFPKEGTLNKLGTDISLIDEFEIKK